MPSTHADPRVPAIRIAGLIFLAALGALLPVEALAQSDQVKPYVMLLFDTSGSMRWDVCNRNNYGLIAGDNSNECRGNLLSCSSCNTLGCDNGLRDDTRLFKVKRGASNVVSAFGEVTFGLARFRQDARGFVCGTDVRRHGGWRGPPGDGTGGNDGSCSLDAMGTGWNQADLLVPFSDTNQRDILAWMNNCDDYPSEGDCPYGTNPGSGTPSSGCSLCADCGGGCDRELRAGGFTPIAGSLYDLRTTVFPGVVAGDPLSSCRPYKVILLTDGVDNCPGDPVAEAENLFTNASKSIPVHVIGFASSTLQANLDAIANAGGTSSAVIVDNEVSLALAMANIIAESILTESCNGVDDDCDGKCDEIWPEVGVNDPSCSDQRAPQNCTAGLGICQRTGNYVCTPDGKGITCNATAGQPDSRGEVCDNNLDDDCDGAVDEGCNPCVPQTEVCDGKDNDCNSIIDDVAGVGATCGSGVGECETGTRQCRNTPGTGWELACVGGIGPQTEICDGKDNDCDGVDDDNPSGLGQACGSNVGECQQGTTACVGGREVCSGEIGPRTEVCDGLDNDCNNSRDDSVPGVGQQCGTDVGRCTRGTFSCQSTVAGFALVCIGEVAPELETCDGEDDDCDGQTDEEFPEQAQACGSNAGECTAGQWECRNGDLVCIGAVGGSGEVCDGKDNDCNGEIDDNISGTNQPCGTNVGECSQGRTQCVGGLVQCVGQVGPLAEICDGKDNDCDGTPDNDAPCPGGGKCVDGECVLPCAGGEFGCPGGTRCDDGFCIPDICADVECEDTQRCIEGACVEKCDGVICESFEICRPTTGRCVDDSCVTKGCPDGETCIAYECISDPCPQDRCASNQMCDDGSCFETCLNVDCASGRACSRGSCVEDPCAGVDCPENQTCSAEQGLARCVPDPCRLVSCNAGQICIQGECQSDPCDAVRCPAYLRCAINSQGLADCIRVDGVAVPTTTQLLATGGGGCACDTSSSNPPQAGWTLMVLGLLALRSARRRRRQSTC